MQVYSLTGGPSLSRSPMYGGESVTVFPLYPQGSKPDTATLIMGGISRLISAYSTWGFSEMSRMEQASKETGHGGGLGSSFSAAGDSRYWGKFLDSWTGKWGYNYYQR